MRDHSYARLEVLAVAAPLQDTLDLLWRFSCCILGFDFGLKGKTLIELGHTVPTEGLRRNSPPCQAHLVR